MNHSLEVFLMEKVTKEASRLITALALTFHLSDEKVLLLSTISLV
jgi:hypothetical protein